MVGTSVADVSASDEDDGDNGRITILIIGGDPNSQFKVSNVSFQMLFIAFITIDSFRVPHFNDLTYLELSQIELKSLKRIVSRWNILAISKKVISLIIPI